MLTMPQLLTPIARMRTDEVVVTTMSAVRPWGRLSSHDLDFASADSAMGHAADLALGIALARPERKTICINGDGSMLMCLGTLATAVEVAARNFVLIVADNGVYEITGHQRIPGSGRLDFAGLAEAAGFRNVFAFDDARAWAEAADSVMAAPGPTLVHVVVEPGGEGPIGRTSAEPARYLQHSLADWSRVVRHALTAPT
ncbi:MAG: thiamine pyrophosphate-dependent enzyme [Gemmatimonadota bacterium]